MSHYSHHHVSFYVLCFSVADDLDLDASADDDLFSFFDDPMDELSSQAQYISPTDLCTIRNARPDVIDTCVTYPRAKCARALRRRGRTINDPESNDTRSSRLSTYQSTAKKYTKGSDYMDSFNNRYGNDKYVPTHSGKSLIAGSGYQFPKRTPHRIEQLMAFWENDFQVGENVYPKMGSWEKMGIVSAMKNVPKDYDKYCIYENFAKEWLSCSNNQAMWTHKLTEVYQILNCPNEHPKHYPADAQEYSIDSCSVLKKQTLTSHLMEKWYGAN